MVVDWYLIPEIFKTLRLGNLVVLAIAEASSSKLLERSRVWRLGNWCGALNNRSMFWSLVLLRSKVTKC